ncbi:hypothetical protein [Dactylosporangium sp. CA-233914]|uniref:hypothetical protein n=1 Tax=Dactylosporangium sp. CA-233914 TaxID=3239934 RepID=UPI003D8F026E
MRRLLVVLLGFVGVTAVGGAVAMAFGALPGAWLDGIPLVDSWLLPGLVLGLGFGAGSLITALRIGQRWASAAAAALGPGWWSGSGSRSRTCPSSPGSSRSTGSSGRR